MTVHLARVRVCAYEHASIIHRLPMAHALTVHLARARCACISFIANILYTRPQTTKIMTGGDIPDRKCSYFIQPYSCNLIALAVTVGLVREEQLLHDLCILGTVTVEITQILTRAV